MNVSMYLKALVELALGKTSGLKLELLSERFYRYAGKRMEMHILV